MSKGHLRELSPGRWQVMWDIDPDPVTGKRRQRSLTIRGNRQAADEALQKILADRSAGVPMDDRTLTVEGLSALWLTARRTQVRSSTIKGYGQKLGYLNEFIGHRKIAQVTGGVLTALYGRLLERGLSARTVMHVHRVTRRMFADAVRWGYLRSNPADAADSPQPVKIEMATWSAAEVKSFLERWSDDYWYPLWHVACATGMRRGELLGLRWSDLQDDFLRVERSMGRDGSGLATGPPKTKAGRRSVALDPGTLAVLGRWRRTQIEQRLLVGREWPEGDWLFTMSNGGPVDPDYITKLFPRRVKETPGVKRIRFHDLRHTWATLAIEAGVPAKVVSERLGHASITMTLDTYTHRVEALHREAAERVGRLIGL